MQVKVDNWKSASIPRHQLDLNLQELSSKSKYPPHWKSILATIPSKDRIVDIGCGVGSIAGLLEKEGLTNSYLGIDFSDNMIQCATEHWKNYEFKVGDVMHLDDIRENDILLCNGLLNTMPNAIHALHKILSYRAKYVLLSRLCIDVTEQHGTYNAYGTIVPKYTYSRNTFYSIIDRCKYLIEKVDNSTGTYLLKRL
jgi:ubiquinone/menaquinone biosynthesis C-methylase UbiE